MNCIGFRKEMDLNKVRSQFFDLHISEIELSKTERDRAVEFLNNGVMVLGMTLAVFDEDEYLGGYRILTDGCWVWPSHYSHFLKKQESPNVAENFIRYLKEIDFVFPNMTDEKILEVKKFVQGKILDFDK